MKRASKRAPARKNRAAGREVPAMAGASVTGRDSRATRLAAADPVIAIASQLRIPQTFDPLGQSGADLPDLSQSRMMAVSNLFTGIQQVHSSLSALLTAMTDPPAPAQVIGSLTQPDGSHSAALQIQFDHVSLGTSSPVVTAVSDKNGSFQF